MPVERWSDSVAVVHLGSDPQFTEDLDAFEHMLTGGRLDAVLDFSGVQYLNSSNIGHLLRVRQAMVKADSRLVLCSVDTRLWSTFLVTSLDKVFEFSANVPTGLATLQMT